MEIRRMVTGDGKLVLAASHLFDGPARPDATRAFLADARHHLLIAYEGDQPVGFVSGVETTHPDRGTEMFLYELGVDEGHRRRGTGRALTDALAALAREAGCGGMWVATEADNVPARATYRAAGATEEPGQTVFSWAFG